MKSRKGTVFIFSTHDISTVQGTTEAYYVSTYFGEIFDTHTIGPLSSAIEGTTTHSYAGSGFLGLFLMNVLLLPRWIWLGYRKHPDVVYGYRNVILPPLVLKLLFGSIIVTDLRVHPVKQPKEFNSDTLENRAFVKLAWGGHMALLRFSDVILTLSKPLQESLSDSFGIPEDEIHIVPLGVDTDVFDPPDDEQTNDFSIAYMGSIKPHRGIESIFAGLNELSSEYQQQITVELFGPTPDHYAEEIESIASAGEYSLGWHGLIPHEEVPTRVGRCDCAISPLPPHEGFEVSSPAKIYEYLALAMPIIATKITPHERILEHESDSLLVEPSNAIEMAKAIERLLTNRSLRVELGENARAKGIENRWQNRIKKIIEALETETNIDATSRL